MRILITGAGGFIGSHLVEAAIRGGHSVRAMVRYSSQGKTGWLNPTLCERVHGDVRDRDVTLKASRGMEAVIHLAALGGIPYSYAAPESYLSTNVMGTFNVLAACLDRSIPVIIASTSEVYGTGVETVMGETHKLSAQSPYAASKIAADQLALSFHKSYGLPVSVIRPFNVFGPRQSTRAVIPSMIVQHLRNGVISLGNSSTVRDWTYVESVVDGFLFSLKGGAVGQVVNIGSGEARTVLDVAKMISTTVMVSTEGRTRPEASEVQYLRCDNRLALERLGWSNAWTFEAGLAKTVEWYRNNLSCFDPEFVV